MKTPVTAPSDSAVSSSRCARNLAAVALVALTALASATADAADFRGFASAGPLGVILFQPCEGKTMSPRTFKIEDNTPDGALMAGIDDVRAIMLNSGRPLYVEFRGDAKGILVTARQFQRAVGTAESCIDAPRDIPAGVRFWAGGGDPGWLFVATVQGAQLERPGEKPVRFPAAPFLAPSKGDGHARRRRLVVAGRRHRACRDHRGNVQRRPIGDGLRRQGDAALRQPQLRRVCRAVLTARPSRPALASAARPT